MAATLLFLSCEHGNNHIPTQYQPLFKGMSDILESHRGYDRGALQLFNQLRHELSPEFAIYSETCRLIVDLNRSLHRRSLFSEWTKPLSKQDKIEILNLYYFPYRQQLIEELDASVANDKAVLHLSVHSFTPILNGIERQTDIGILYNPERATEKTFAMHWKKTLQHHLPQLRVRYNYPYLGKPDGHVAYHRKKHDDNKYAGIELELNQKHAGNREVYNGIIESLKEVLAQYQ